MKFLSKCIVKIKLTCIYCFIPCLFLQIFIEVSLIKIKIYGQVKVMIYAVIHRYIYQVNFRIYNFFFKSWNNIPGI